MRQAIQAGASEVERAGIVQDCIARSKAMSAPYRERQLGDDQGLPGWIVGINYEKAGRYAEAAAVYQKTLNDEGYPNGDGLPAGERLGYLYANGRGVPKDAAKARQLFGANQTLRNRDDLLLLNHHMLPLTPEGKTPALIEKATAMVAEEQRKALEEQAKAEAEESRRAQAWRTSHPELARAQDCRASCEQAVQSCTTKNLGMNWQVPSEAGASGNTIAMGIKTDAMHGVLEVGSIPRADGGSLGKGTAALGVPKSRFSGNSLALARSRGHVCRKI
jgi:hypothetical protein